VAGAPEPASVFTRAAGLRIHHLDWGGEGPVVVCLHGLTRSGHDFDALARRLAPRWRVLCPDARGRGESDRAPADSYHFEQYASDLRDWLDALGLERVHLIGTSMGGATSMLFAAAHPRRAASVVLNDIGPAIEMAGLLRIGQYVADAPERFPDLDAVAEWQARTNPSSRMSRADLLEWARWQTRPLAGGGFGWHYDRAIRDAMRNPVPPTRVPPDLWAACEAMPGPTLVVRGGASDILSPATVEQMKARMERLSAVEVPGVGHAPTLVEPEALAALEPFLRAA
jgi:pimeloyl-ACP methyl ester carboxylesterase